MLEEIKPTIADMDLQDKMMDAAVQKIIELKPEWIDVCAAGLRLYLIVCDDLGGQIPELRFVHSSKPCRIQFRLNETPDGQAFTANDINKENQIAVLDEILKVAEACPEGHSLMDLAICSGRLFMIGYDGLAGTIDKVCLRHNKKNYSMNLINADAKDK